MTKLDAQILLLETLAALSLIVWGEIGKRVLDGRPVVPYEPRRPVPWTGAQLALIVVAILLAPQLLAATVGRYLQLPIGEWERDSRYMIVVLFGRAVCVALAAPLVHLASGASVADLGLGLKRLGSDLR